MLEVSVLEVSVLEVSVLDVSVLERKGRREEEEEDEEDRRIQPQKQKPHTTMWGNASREARSPRCTTGRQGVHQTPWRA